MKKIIFLFPFILLLACGEKPIQTQSQEPMSDSILTQVEPDSVLRHVVFFSFKNSATPDDVKAIIDSFRELKNQIDGIKSFEWGTNSSPEGLNQRLTHAFTLTFHSNSDRDAYLPHPAHKEFGSLLGPHLDKVMVVDYWTKP